MRLLVNRSGVTVQLRHPCARWTSGNFLPGYLDDLLNGAWTPSGRRVKSFQPAETQATACSQLRLPSLLGDTAFGWERFTLCLCRVDAAPWLDRAGTAMWPSLSARKEQRARHPASRLPADVMARVESFLL